MRLSSLRSLPAAIILLFSFFCSCIKTPPHFDPRDANNVYTGCRVQEIDNPQGSESPVLTHKFIYNSNNDPVSVTSNVPATGDPDLIFKYDNKNRLIEYTGLYENGGFEFYHRYSYNQNRAVTDTEYVLGVYGNLNAYYANKRITYLFYDDLNRVIEDSSVYAPPVTLIEVRKYNYNQDGNYTGVTYNGSLSSLNYVYDDKLNPHRTNKIWMFIDRNYSVNNPVAAATYNSFGLPLSYPSEEQIYPYFNFGYFAYSGLTTIMYNCK